MKLLMSVAAATLLAAGAAQAATVVDFNEFAHNTPVRTYSAPIVSKGFSFTSDVARNGLGIWGSINNADPGGATLLNWSAEKVTVQRTDGGAFSLASMDLADTYNQGAPSQFLFTFFDGTDTTTELVTLDRVRGLQTWAFNRSRLEWFSYAQVGTMGMQVDNLVFGDAASAAVPEPGAWALMILGFGAAGAALRRRRIALA
jgi:hypothetical protein